MGGRGGGGGGGGGGQNFGLKSRRFRAPMTPLGTHLRHPRSLQVESTLLDSSWGMPITMQGHVADLAKGSGSCRRSHMYSGCMSRQYHMRRLPGLYAVAAHDNTAKYGVPVVPGTYVARAHSNGRATPLASRPSTA